MYRVDMSYNLKETRTGFFSKQDLQPSELERIAELSTQIKNCKAQIEFNSAPKYDVFVDVYLASEEHAYVVLLQGKDRARITDALDKFIEQCGAPDFVTSGYDLILPVLSKKGQTLKRKFAGLLAGKHVVPA